LFTTPLEEIIEKVPENASKFQMLKKDLKGDTTSNLTKNVKAGITKSFIQSSDKDEETKIG